MAGKNKIEVVLSAVDKNLSTVFNRAIGSIKGFFTGSKGAESGINGMTGAVTKLLAPLAGVVSATAGVKKLVEVSREFDKISAGLVTATGSADGAEEAFGAIQDFAAKTPFDLAQVADSFVKLVNYGLTPSERAMTSYGNTSSALGKDLNQMIEAVSDAATGEFERLKEFGIKASSEGNKVSLTFRGVKTTVGKNAKEIEEYLIKLGETNFGDAMANRMDTLDGAMSNLGDEWNKLFLNISMGGVGDIIRDAVDIAIGALSKLNATISSGELESYLRAAAGQFSGWAEDVGAAIDIVKNRYDESMRGIEDGGSETVRFLVDAFRRFPENVRSFIGLTTVYVTSELDEVVATARYYKNVITAVFTDDTISGAAGRYAREMSVINEARDESIDSILKERDATIEASERQIQEAKKRRAEYEAGQKATSEDRLAKYKVKTDGKGVEVDEVDKKVKSVNDSIVEAIRKAQAEIAGIGKSAYEKRMAEIDSEAQKYLSAGADKVRVAEWVAAETRIAYQSEIEEQKKVTAERLRAASQERILALEKEKIAASTLPSELDRAEAELDIDRRIMEERVALKREELAAIKAEITASQADIIQAESELAELLVNNEIALNDRLRDISARRMDDIELSWRRGIVAAEEYQAAVRNALEAGAITKRQADEKLVSSGDDMGAALSMGFRNAKENMQTDAEVMAKIGEQLPNQIAGGLGSAWDSFIDGSKSASEAMADFASQTLKWISQIILQQMVLNAVKGVSGAYSSGGEVAAMASGGSVPGWSPSPTADNIPAWLTAGEFVHPVRAVDYYGLPFMEAIRRLQLPKNLAHALSGGTIPSIPSGYRLASGGQAATAPATTVKTGDIKLKVVNVNDKNLMGDYMKSSDGETTLINVIRRNGSTIRKLIGG